MKEENAPVVPVAGLPKAANSVAISALRCPTGTAHALYRNQRVTTWVSHASALVFALLPLPAAAAGFYELTPREPLPAAYASAPCAGSWHGPAPWGTIPASPCVTGVQPAVLLAGAPFGSGVVTASAAPQSAPLAAVFVGGGGSTSAPVSPALAPCCSGWTPGGDNNDDTPLVAPGDGDMPNPSPVPLPAGFGLLLAALGGLRMMRGRT